MSCFGNLEDHNPTLPASKTMTSTGATGPFVTIVSLRAKPAGELRVRIGQFWGEALAWVFGGF